MLALLIGLSGSTSSQIEMEFPRFKCLNGMENGWYNKPVVESKQDFRARAQGFAQYILQLESTPVELRRIGDTQGFQNIMVIAHGNFINAVMSELLGTQNQSLFMHHNTAYSHLELYTDTSQRKVIAIQCTNRLDHIDFETESDLITGSDVIRDHWIQEYLD
jgi:broad specificity phosphatase PhoE